MRSPSLRGSGPSSCSSRDGRARVRACRARGRATPARHGRSSRPPRVARDRRRRARHPRHARPVRAHVPRHSGCRRQAPSSRLGRAPRVARGLGRRRGSGAPRGSSGCAPAARARGPRRRPHGTAAAPGQAPGPVRGRAGRPTLSRAPTAAASGTVRHGAPSSSTATRSPAGRTAVTVAGVRQSSGDGSIKPPSRPPPERARPRPQRPRSGAAARRPPAPARPPPGSARGSSGRDRGSR